MRCLLLPVLLLLTGVVHAEVYRWTDDQGVTHYSDKPHGGAKPVELPPIQVVPAFKPPPGETTSAAPAKPSSAERYATAHIASPADGATLRDNTGTISVQLSVAPDAKAGDYFRVVLDGTESPGRHGGASAVLTEVPRGTHTIGANIYGPNDNLLKQVPSVTVYLHEASTNPNPLQPADPNNPYKPSQPAAPYKSSPSNGTYTPGSNTYKPIPQAPSN